MNELTFIIVAVLWIILGFHYIGGKSMNYSLTHSGISIKQFGVILITRIPYEEILEVKLISMWKANLFIPLFAIKLGYRLWGKGAVQIKKKRGIRKIIIITPENPEMYIQDLQSKIGKN
jgi:hypothetical protein